MGHKGKRIDVRIFIILVSNKVQNFISGSADRGRHSYALCTAISFYFRGAYLNFILGCCRKSPIVVCSTSKIEF